MQSTPATSRRLGDRECKGLTRAERRKIRAAQFKLAALSRKKKHTGSGLVSLEVERSIRKSIEAHMRRTK